MFNVISVIMLSDYMIHIAFLYVFLRPNVFMGIEYLTRDSHIRHLIGGTWCAIDKMNSFGAHAHCVCARGLYLCVCGFSSSSSI